MNRFFQIYQYAVPAVLFPAGYVLWLQRFGGNHALACLVLSLPVVFGYVIPGIGTNYLKLWEFNTCVRVGRYRPHHGFVFGTAVSLFGLLCHDPGTNTVSFTGLLRAGFILGSVMAFWNWLYDTIAVKADFIRIHKPPHYHGVSTEAVIMEYAPILFGVFGFCYGIFVNLTYHYLFQLNQGHLYWPFLFWGNLSVLVMPVLVFCCFSLGKYGKFGIESILKGGER